MSSVSNVSEPKPSGRPPATAVKPAGSAYDIVDREAERTKREFFAALAGAKTALGQAVDPKQIPEKHPILTVTSAVVAGFTAAVIAIPSKEQQELRRIAKLHQAMHPTPDPAPTAKSAAAVEGPWWMSIVHELIQLARPVLTAVITAKAAKPKPADPAPSQTVNGATPDHP